MPGTTTLVWTALQPTLEGTAFGDYLPNPPRDDGATDTQVLWCAATPEFVRRHPTVTAAVDAEHPDGCTDLVVDVDDRGNLDGAWIECLDVDEGLVGRPVADVLPELARRLTRVLR
jgi:hypothetical protein